MKDKKEEVKVCECCGNDIKVKMAAAKFCNNCSLQHYHLRRDIHSLTSRNKALMEKNRYYKTIIEKLNQQNALMELENDKKQSKNREGK